MNVKVYDHREGKVIRVFDDLHSGYYGYDIFPFFFPLSLQYAVVMNFEIILLFIISFHYDDIFGSYNFRQAVCLMCPMEPKWRTNCKFI